MLSAAYTVTMKNNHLKNPLTASQKKRLVRLLLAAGCFVLLSWVGINSSHQSHQLLYDSANSAAKSLTQFMALNAKNPLIEKNKSQLTTLCNNISKDEFVLSATIYDKQGVLHMIQKYEREHKNKKNADKNEMTKTII